MVLRERLELSILSELVPKTSASTIPPPEHKGILAKHEPYWQDWNPKPREVLKVLRSINP